MHREEIARVSPTTSKNGFTVSFQTSPLCRAQRKSATFGPKNHVRMVLSTRLLSLPLGIVFVVGTTHGAGIGGKCHRHVFFIFCMTTVSLVEMLEGGCNTREARSHLEW